MSHTPELLLSGELPTTPGCAPMAAMPVMLNAGVPCSIPVSSESGDDLFSGAVSSCSDGQARPGEAEFVDQRGGEGAGVAVADALRVNGAVDRGLRGLGQRGEDVGAVAGHRATGEDGVLGAYLDVTADDQVVIDLELGDVRS